MTEVLRDEKIMELVYFKYAIFVFWEFFKTEEKHEIQLQK